MNYFQNCFIGKSLSLPWPIANASNAANTIPIAPLRIFLSRPIDPIPIFEQSGMRRSKYLSRLLTCAL